MHPATRHATLAMMLLALPTAAAFATDAATIAQHGNGRGAPACASCHGAEGGGQAAAGFPRLAGLNAAYLRKQLDDFANGTRANPVMQPIAAALNESERKTMAEYYHRMPVPAALSKPVTRMPADHSLGARLALRGLWGKQVPACVACHGPHGIGVGAHFPPLAGQPAAYIAAQLNDWKQGTRHNDPLALMQHVSSALDEQDIHAVAAWFAAQPLAAKGTTP
ncbi:MAG: c-type cytochrome [Rhodanobacteraceae bacterium]|nr:MAG: c-type cytochrome [Rhodanobacteraceae bacterium]